MDKSLKKSVIHGIEVVVASAIAIGVAFFLNNIAPQLPDTATTGLLVFILNGVAKFLRDNKNIPIKDYVNAK